ncbi:MAG TPA: DNA translocase FtsK 4TM domain-containing protein [Thermoleophilaceae bacterium]|nr:DNA translocase FtsK 4TM domain-containing protein [Thermoleophilaceae bacterium]
MPPRGTKRKPAPKRPQRRGGALPFGLPVLEQHHRDLLGLGLVAFGCFLAVVLYGGETGGRAGEATTDALRFLFGGVAYLAPIGLVASGVLLVLRHLLPAVQPFRAGALCLTLGLALGLAGGSLGLGPGAAPHEPLLEASYVSDRGGVLGELLWSVASSLFSDLGAHFLFVFLIVGGVLLLTGASLASILSATGTGVATTTRAVRRSTAELTSVFSSAGGPLTDAGRGRSAAPPAEPIAAGDGPPEPPGVEPVVHATHVEAPALDAEERFPDLFAEDGPPPLDEPSQPPEAEWDEEEPFEAAEGVEAIPDAVEDDPAGDSPDEPVQEPLTPMGNRRTDGVTEADDIDYALPSESFLKRSPAGRKVNTAAIDKVGAQLVEALGHFGVEAKVVGSVSGPHVTRYELRLAPGIKMSKVSNMRDDLAYALAADDVRILAPIPGKRAVGVEVPNTIRHMVHLGDVSQDPPDGWSPLAVWLGKDIDGRAIGIDLAQQPHVLVAGTTGAGKSGAVNAMLASILMRSSPNDVRLVLVDPKQVELNLYEHIPHLLTPVVTSPRLAANVLQNLIGEMEQRYTLMSKARTRKLEELNRARVRDGERPLPYILCVIDELADLMMIAPGEVEDAIIRLAQKSRAVGIHLLLATQRPSADIITGMIKANVPARIAFAVSSQTDSRVILDQNGAESLLGKGDMLFKPGNGSKLNRIQGAFVDEVEIEKLTAHWRRQGEPELHEELLEAVESDEPEDERGDYDPDQDELLAEAIRTVVQMDTASTSMLQRRLRVGYTRAGRLIDMLERRGVISGYEGSKARKVLISEGDLSRVLAALDEPAGAAVGAGADEAP